MITVSINQEPVTVAEASTLEQLIKGLLDSVNGHAAAVNQVIVPRADWGSYVVNDGDQISLFQAIAGG